ncbi:S16 family serine protease [Anaerotignum sp. MB30-C6]|uniref:S16 family serine protease n=1 Tax=Anaerotignum sp. MB30-C6 TaxID=3070814 RepID=UPI0027DEA408|nr:S16 family serine protease [Anaerotignum sp. MB30-C6]WMI81625.1 S16 family serine protease [Anaerotignum sp. MB30-C6]
MTGWSVLTIVQLLFFGMGTYYFFTKSKKKLLGGGFSPDENLKQMEDLENMRSRMLTEPLAEQTRPRDLTEIIGQEKAVKALRAALCGPNPQHILIYGPPGVGKTAAARLILEEAIKKADNPFDEKAKFVEIDATTLQFDERNIADPLMGSVHDPIYQGAGAFGQVGVPQPRPGAICEAHGGVLFIDEIGELHPVQMNKLLKVLEDRIARFQSSYYSRNNKNIPPYIHEIFQKGMPADFRLIGATTRNPSDIAPALRSRCTEIFFEGLDERAVEQIARNSLNRGGVPYEEGLCEKIACYARGGRDTVNMVQSLTSLAAMEGNRKITFADLDWVAETGRYQPILRRKVSGNAQIGVVNGMAVQGSGGGTLLAVEATVQKASKGFLTVTGIVEEEEIRGRQHSSRRKSNARSSAENVLTVLEKYGFIKDEYQVHINFPGGTPVDGPSAGVAMFLAVYSAFTGVPVDSEVALTGEIGLLGQVLPVGGVADKLEAAVEAGVKLAFIPKENWRENYTKLGITVEPLEHVDSLLEHVFKKDGDSVIVDESSVLTAKERD